MIRYRVCQSMDSDRLCKMVEDYLNDGYVLHGGLVANDFEDIGYTAYYQAVIKYIFEEKEDEN